MVWENIVTDTTIQRCWKKSTLIQCIEDIEQNTTANEIDQWIELQAQLNSLPIEDPLSLDEFLNPESEIIINNNANIFELVGEHYSVEKEGEESEKSSNGEEEPIIPAIEALRCLESLRSWKLQQEETDTSVIHVLDRLE